MLTLRRAVPQDAAAIAHVHIESWKTTYAGILPAGFLDALSEPDRTAQWQQWLTLDLPVFVALLDDKIVGFIGGGPIREPLQPFDAELFALYVLASAQRRGVGTALLHQLAEALRARGLTSMIVWVLEQNPSKAFYRQAGAHPLTTKSIEIAGLTLTEEAYGWPSLATIC